MLDRNTLLVREEHEARFSLLCTLISTKNLFVNADPSVGQVFPSCPKQMVELGVNVRYCTSNERLTGHHFFTPHRSHGAVWRVVIVPDGSYLG